MLSSAQLSKSFHRHFLTVIHPQFQTKTHTFCTTRLCRHGHADVLGARRLLLPLNRCHFGWLPFSTASTQSSHVPITLLGWHFASCFNMLHVALDRMHAAKACLDMVLRLWLYPWQNALCSGGTMITLRNLISTDVRAYLNSHGMS